MRIDPKSSEIESDSSRLSIGTVSAERLASVPLEYLPLFGGGLSHRLGLGTVGRHESSDSGNFWEISCRTYHSALNGPFFLLAVI